MQPQVADRTSAAATVSTMAIWDPLVRVAHWSIVAGFFLAYFTEDDVLTLHVWAGYAVGVLVLLRIVWGFVGPQHARFSDFLYRPSEVVTYLRDLLTFRATRYLGHSPAGAAMVFALLAGLVTQANAPYVASEVDGDNAETSGTPGDNAGELWEEMHELAANLTMLLVVVHVAGVLLASFVHRENLAQAMIIGRKRPL